MTRVVQIEPGPMPTFTASAPASIRSRQPSAVATLPATTSISHCCLDLLDRLDDVRRMAVGTIDDQDIDVLVDQAVGPLEVEHADRRSDPQPSLSHLCMLAGTAASCRCL